MLNETIAKLRKEKNLSQEELASILNTSRQAISKWERGDAYPDLDKLKDLAIYFNVSIDYLFDYDIESVSINNLIKRINESIENKKYNIDLEEIELIISRNKNNFDLLIHIINYLISSWSYADNKDYISSLIIDYCNRALIIYRSDNTLNVKEEEIKRVIAISYMLNKKYELSKDYIINNEVRDVDTVLANCEFHLGNYKRSEEIVSELFLKSISGIINSNIIKVLLLIETNSIKEALDLINWSFSFVKSIEKEKEIFQELIFIYIFFRALCQKILNMDIKDDMEYLKNHNKFIINENEAQNIKFYNNEDNNVISLIDNIDETIMRMINKYKDKDFYDKALMIYKEVFGE